MSTVTNPCRFGPDVGDVRGARLHPRARTRRRRGALFDLVDGCAIDAVVLSSRGVKEAEIVRRADVTAIWRSAGEDARAFLGDRALREPAACRRAARRTRQRRPFEVDGFPFVGLRACGLRSTPSPRPRADALDRFYRDSPSSRVLGAGVLPGRPRRAARADLPPAVERILGHPRLAGASEELVAVDVGAGAGNLPTSWRPRARWGARRRVERARTWPRSAAPRGPRSSRRRRERARAAGTRPTCHELRGHRARPTTLAFVSAIGAWPARADRRAPPSRPGRRRLRRGHARGRANAGLAAHTSTSSRSPGSRGCRARRADRRRGRDGRASSTPS